MIRTNPTAKHRHLVSSGHKDGVSLHKDRKPSLAEARRLGLQAAKMMRGDNFAGIGQPECARSLARQAARMYYEVKGREESNMVYNESNVLEALMAINNRLSQMSAEIEELESKLARYKASQSDMSDS